MTQTSSQSAYLQVATQMQRWRDFGSYLTGYVTMNLLFVLIWAAGGRGFCWPLFPLLGWGVGLSSQHFMMVVRGQITDAQVQGKLAVTDPPVIDR